MIERKRQGRKLLIASIGVAAVSYVACGDTSTTDTGGAGGSNTAGSANSGGSSTAGHVNVAGALVANLIAPPEPDASDAKTTVKDAASDPMTVGLDNSLVANLIAPPDPDANLK